MFIPNKSMQHRTTWRGLLTCFLASSLTVGLAVSEFLNPAMLIADDVDLLRFNPPSGYMAMISEDELGAKTRADAGWPCGEDGRPCAHILVNTSDQLLCVPAQTSGGYLTIPLEHFRLIAGCGLEIGLDGRLRLIKYDKAYQLDIERGTLTRGTETWVLPVPPEVIHGTIYVPLRFLCETLNLDIQWHEASGVVLLNSPWVDTDALADPMTRLNGTILTALREHDAKQVIEKETLPLSEPFEITVTFYYSSKDTTYTASGYQAVAGSIAADSAFPFGTQFYIPELDFISEGGIFTVHDRGGSVKGNKIDIFLPNSIRKDPAVSAALRRGRFTVTGHLVTPKGDT